MRRPWPTTTEKKRQKPIHSFGGFDKRFTTTTITTTTNTKIDRKLEIEMGE
jgi:hypothetical protein